MDIKIKMDNYLENDNIKIDNIKFQKMLLLFNSIEQGWTVKKRNDSYVFTKNHENKKEIMSQMVSPIDSPIENMSDVLAKEPFLKDSEVSSENEAAFVSETILPLDSTSAVNDEISEEDAPFLMTNEGVDESTLSSNDSNKISYDLFDSETNSGDDYSFELNQDEINNACKNEHIHILEWFQNLYFKE